MPDPSEVIARLRELEAAATPGPWWGMLIFIVGLLVSLLGETE